jgi:hypothetical protein
MQLFRIGAFILPVILVIPATAAAQRRVPATDSAAIGGDVGVFIARDETLDSGLTLEGFYEYYFSPRTSMRVGLGWAEPSFDREDEDSMRYVRIPFDVVRNWEGGAVHPFVGAGLGIYFLQAKDNGRSIGDSETKLGGTLFGGAEFFTGRRTAVKAEARYHIISNTGGFNPDGLAVTIGLKQYF